jgi:hypothetical protein
MLNSGDRPLTGIVLADSLFGTVTAFREQAGARQNKIS